MVHLMQYRIEWCLERMKRICWATRFTFLFSKRQPPQNELGRRASLTWSLIWPRLQPRGRLLRTTHAAPLHSAPSDGLQAHHVLDARGWRKQRLKFKFWNCHFGFAAAAPANLLRVKELASS